MSFWNNALLIVGGLMGVSGVALAAAGAHAGGANLSTAATFLLIHAAAVTALALHGGSSLFLLAATLLAAGACLFAGDLAVRFWGAARLFPMAAPAGGLGMIAGWLCLSLAALAAAITRP
ncbi:MAG: DUF423 domain-containing protein [Beijerinckiaceae bacterium]|nr:DUF423 domain-containing protein [Beijerinckiaceae bacterium]